MPFWGVLAPEDLFLAMTAKVLARVLHPLGYETYMRYQTKLLITAGLLLAMSLSAAALAYWGVTQSHSYLSRSRIAHQELERQLQLSRHSQQLFKAWTDTLLTGISDRPLGAAYLHQVIESDLAELERLTQTELAMIAPRNAGSNPPRSSGSTPSRASTSMRSTSSTRSSNCAAAGGPTSPGRRCSRF